VPQKDKQEYNAYSNAYMKTRYRVFMDEKIEQLGGKCVRCDSVTELEFDHIDPATKEFGIGKGWSKNPADVEKELRKCQLLCKTCHLEKTREGRENGKPAPVHGSHWMYKKYKCRCEPCVIANSETIRRYKENHKNKLARQAESATQTEP
jgi:hypothetical protein